MSDLYEVPVYAILRRLKEPVGKGYLSGPSHVTVSDATPMLEGVERVKAFLDRQPDERCEIVRLMPVDDGRDVVEIDRETLFLLVSCASRYDSRLPYGVVPPDIWALLTPAQREQWERDAQR